MNKELIKEKLSQVDDILCQFEDYMHGEEGEDCSKARKLLIETTDLLQSLQGEECEHRGGNDPQEQKECSCKEPELCRPDGVREYCNNCGRNIIEQPKESVGEDIFEETARKFAKLVDENPEEMNARFEKLREQSVGIDVYDYFSQFSQQPTEQLSAEEIKPCKNCEHCQENEQNPKVCCDSCWIDTKEQREWLDVFAEKKGYNDWGHVLREVDGDYRQKLTAEAVREYAKSTQRVSDEEIDALFPLKEDKLENALYNSNQCNKREGAKALRDKWMQNRMNV